MPKTEPSRLLLECFDHLLRELGPQEWWPARTRFEVILGAILTQNTSWLNAARAIKNLRKSERLCPKRLERISRAELENLIRPAGFYRQKAQTIRNFLEWLKKACRGSLPVMFNLPETELRRELLKIQGLGPETADAILLYAGRRPFFVADAYTRRILERHGLLPAGAEYADAQEFLHQNLPSDHRLFNEYHALLVEIGKRHCRRSEALCTGCPLEVFLPYSDIAGNGGETKLPPLRKARGDLSRRPPEPVERADSLVSLSEV